MYDHIPDETEFLKWLKVEEKCYFFNRCVIWYVKVFATKFHFLSLKSLMESQRSMTK